MKATKEMIAKVDNAIMARRERSAWGRGVQVYAGLILSAFDDWATYNEREGLDAPEFDEATALNGARDWSQWAYGGCGLVSDAYIAERLCTPSELRRVRGGERMPAKGVTWLDVEARAARQAWRMIAEVVRVVEYEQVKAEAVEGLQKLHGISEAEAVEQFECIIKA